MRLCRDYLWCCFASAVCLLALTLCLPEQASARDWVEVTSPHFRVITDQRSRDARRVALDLERMRQLYVQGLPRAVTDPFRPVVAVVVEDGDDLASWLPQFAEGLRPGGVFSSRPYSHSMVIRLDAGQQVIYASYLHLLIRLNTGILPLWLSQGLASFYANTEFVGSKAKFGQPNINDLRYLNGRSLIPLEDVLSEDDAYATDDSHDVRVFYAQAWALTHYLMLGNQTLATNGALQAYIDLVQDNVDSVEAFEQAVGPLETLREELRVYMRRLQFSYLTLELTENLDDDTFETRDLPAHEVLAERALLISSTILSALIR